MENITLFALILSKIATFSYAQTEVNNPVARSRNEREVSITPIQLKRAGEKVGKCAGEWELEGDLGPFSSSER